MSREIPAPFYEGLRGKIRRATLLYDAHRMTGKLGFHALRKTYAVRLYKLLGKDLVKTQRAMGHESVNSAVKYLQDFSAEDIDQAILSA